MLYCPQCGAGYRNGFMTCTDCHVAPAPEPPRDPSKPADDPFVPFRGTYDPLWRDRFTDSLKRAEIPFVVLNREDFLFNFRAKVPFTICVRNSDFAKAEKALDDELGSDEEWMAAREAGAFTLPDHYVPQENKGVWDPDAWYPEDATVEVWSADSPERSETRGDKTVLFVLPGDEPRARNRPPNFPPA